MAAAGGGGSSLSSLLRAGASGAATPFTEADVAATFKPKRSWLRRRAG
jgi:hypothetical protein